MATLQAVACPSYDMDDKVKYASQSPSNNDAEVDDVQPHIEAVPILSALTDFKDAPVPNEDNHDSSTVATKSGDGEGDVDGNGDEVGVSNTSVGTSQVLRNRVGSLEETTMQYKKRGKSEVVATLSLHSGYHAMQGRRPTMEVLRPSPRLASISIPISIPDTFCYCRTATSSSSIHYLMT